MRIRGSKLRGIGRVATPEVVGGPENSTVLVLNSMVVVIAAVPI